MPKTLGSAPSYIINRKDKMKGLDMAIAKAEYLAWMNECYLSEDEWDSLYLLTEGADIIY